MERGVPGREQLITKPDCLRNNGGVRFTHEVRFTAAGVDVGVGTHERVEDAGLVPAGEKFLARVAEETTDVRSNEGKPSDVVGENHGDRGRKVRPVGLIVTRPYSAKALGTSEEGPRENKWTTGRLRVAIQKTVECCVGEREAIQVVNVAVLPVVMVKIVFRHRSFRAVEDGGFVHIVPDECVGSCARKEGVSEETRPPFSGCRIKTIDPIG